LPAADGQIGDGQIGRLYKRYADRFVFGKKSGIYYNTLPSNLLGINLIWNYLFKLCCNKIIVAVTVFDTYTASDFVEYQ
jgi:hypothetical protein